MARHPDMSRLVELYKHLHANPELSGQEVHTSDLMASELRSFGYQTITKIGRTGVVGIIDRGPGPIVMLRADMDALPVREETGLPYASTAVAGDEQTPVMHACGHDIHMTAMIGAAEEMAADQSWKGVLMVLFQPAEETGEGARAMLADGLFDKVPRPDIVLGQHVMPIPTGYLGVPPGPAFAAGHNLSVKITGKGGHGSQPERAVNPAGIAAMIAVRLQNLKTTTVGAFDPTVITIGQIRSGSAPNIIPDTAELLLTIRTYSSNTMDLLVGKIKAIAESEATIAGGSATINVLHHFPVLVNDEPAASVLQEAFGEIANVCMVEPQALMISEDVGELATAAGAPLVYWWLGGADPKPFEGRTNATISEFLDHYPSNHSSLFAPVPRPTLDIGIDALVRAAKQWLGTA